MEQIIIPDWAIFAIGIAAGTIALFLAIDQAKRGE